MQPYLKVLIMVQAKETTLNMKQWLSNSGIIISRSTFFKIWPKPDAAHLQLTVYQMVVDKVAQ